MATIHDVARKAKVSKSTVSRVLNGGSVSSHTRAAVMAAIDALDFRPNSAARGLATKTARTIGLVLSDVADPFFSEIIRGIDTCAGEHGYDLLLCSVQWEEQRELRYLSRLAERKVDGLLMVSGRMIRDDAALEAFLQAAGPKRPIVFLDRPLPGCEVCTVGIDNVQAAEDAVRHLLHLGHRRIAHISGPPDVPASHDRLLGYRRALLGAGLEPDMGLVVQGGFQKEGGYAAAHRLLTMPHLPTAIFAANDLAALGAWKAAREAGLAVPHDLALVGFDDIDMLALAEIPLTTVRQPRYQMGFTGARILISLLQEPGQAGVQRVVLPTELVVRESCGHRRCGRLP